jgi:aryl-alcohol dehydrogenase-like predicted oxidoreductase
MTDFLRALGDTGIQVSALGLGTVKIGRNQGVKYPGGFELPDDRQVIELLREARELGINLIDTAPAYGRSEERLGQLLRPRRDWVICAKAGEEFRGGVSRYDFRPEQIKRSVERSLRRLRTDYIDLLLIHSDGNDEDIIHRYGALDVLAELKEKGWIRATGMSTKTVAGGLACLERADAAMVTYNLADDSQRPVIDHAAEKNKAILVKKAFGSGHLCTSGEDPVYAGLEKLLSTAGVTSVIAGTLNPQHLRQNTRQLRRVLADLPRR